MLKILTEMKTHTEVPIDELVSSLREFVDYFKEWEYVINDEMRAILHRAEGALNKAT